MSMDSSTCKMLWCMGVPFLLQLVTVYATMSSDPCYFWPNSVYVNGKCYKIFASKTTWGDAQQYCEQEGEDGTLAEMITEKELAVLVVEKDENYSFLEALWVGATDVTSEGRWVWSSTQSPAPVDGLSAFTQITLRSGVGHCVVMRSGLLLISDCDSGNPDSFICQRSSLPASDPCHFWEHATYVNDKCFGIVQEEKYWTDAQTFCENYAEGGTLAELVDEEERSALIDLRNALSSSVASLWLGAGDVETEGTFVWTTANTGVDDTWWIGSNPDNINNEDCVEFKTNAGKLNDKQCDLSLSFACEVQIENPCNHFLPDDSPEFYHGHCFTFLEGPLSWENATAKCQDNRYFGHLAEPATPELKKYVDAMAIRSTEGAVDKHVWLGGVREGGQWKWAVAGTNITNREFGSDTNTGSFLLLDSLTGAWLSSSSGQHSFICQRELGDPCELYIPGAIFTHGRCVKYFNLPLSWPEARDFCREKGASLAQPKTRKLSDALNIYLKHMGDSYKFSRRVPPHKALHFDLTSELAVSSTVNKTWIGATDEQEEGTFKWIDTDDALTFTAFPTPNPLNPDRDHVIVVDASYWVDENSAAKHPFVCQKAVPRKGGGRHYNAVLPKLQLLSDQEGYLQISHGYLSLGVIITITVTSHTDSYKFSRRVPPRKALQFDLTPELAVSSTGQYSQHLNVNAKRPLTVVMYIRSATAVESTLILPHHTTKSRVFESTKSYFLVSGVTGDGTENAVLVSAVTNNPNVTIMFPVNNSIQVDGISFGPVKTINTILPVDGTVYITSTNSDGAYLRATDRAEVLVTGAASSAAESDFTIEQVLPVQDINTEYVTFPSLPENVTRKDVFRFVATEANTLVEIYYPPAVNGTIQIYLDAASDVKEITLPAQGFYYMKGNSHFYAYKVTRSESGLPSCLTSLFHTNLWRHQYDFETTSRLDGYGVYIAAIVPATMTSLLTMKYVNSSRPVCQNVTGSNYAGCYYHLPKDQRFYYHLHLTNHMTRFAAYLFATKQGSSLCHPMGLWDGTTEIYDFNQGNYLASLHSEPATSVPPPTCPPPATDTTSFSNNSTTIQQSTTSSGIKSTTLDTTHENITTFTTTSVSDDTSVTEPSSEFRDGTTSYMDVSSPTTDTPKTTDNPGMQYTQDIVDQIYRTLHIDKESTSSYRRMKISIPDGRPSSVAIGSVAIIFISLVLGIVLLGDLLTMIKECDISHRKDKK